MSNPGPVEVDTAESAHSGKSPDPHTPSPERRISLQQVAIHAMEKASRRRRFEQKWSEFWETESPVFPIRLGEDARLPKVRRFTPAFLASLLMHSSVTFFLYTFPFALVLLLLKGPAKLRTRPRMIVYKFQHLTLPPYLPIITPGGHRTGNPGRTPAGRGAKLGEHPRSGSSYFDPRITIISNPDHPDNFRLTLKTENAPPKLALPKDLRIPDFVSGGPGPTPAPPPAGKPNQAPGGTPKPASPPQPPEVQPVAKSAPPPPPKPVVPQLPARLAAAPPPPAPQLQLAMQPPDVAYPRLEIPAPPPPPEKKAAPPVKPIPQAGWTAQSKLTPENKSATATPSPAPPEKKPARAATPAAPAEKTAPQPAQTAPQPTRKPPVPPGWTEQSKLTPGGKSGNGAANGSQQGGGGQKIIALSAEPIPFTDIASIPFGNHEGAFSISPAGRSGGTPSGEPGGVPDAGAGGHGPGGQPGVAPGKGSGHPGGEGGGNGGAGSSDGPAVSISGPSGVVGISAGTLPPLKLEDLVYPVKPETPKSHAPNIVVSSSPYGGGGLRVYGALHGGRIYTVYFPMPERSWILQYCIHEKPAPSASTSGAVQLQIQPPITPPAAIDQFAFHRPPAPQGAAQAMVVLHGFISVEGSVNGLTVLEGGDPMSNAAGLAAFARWKFRPALRAGVPVELEILVGIP